MPAYILRKRYKLKIKVVTVVNKTVKTIYTQVNSESPKTNLVSAFANWMVGILKQTNMWVMTNGPLVLISALVFLNNIFFEKFGILGTKFHNHARILADQEI